MKVLKEKKTDYWGTPDNIKELVYQVLGEINTDPCAESLPTKNIKAANYFDINQDGLTKDWVGKVYMNPPYSNPSPWVEKFFAEHELGQMDEGIALLPASTDTKWFKEVWQRSCAICFLHGRIKFLDILDGYKQKYPARTGSALIYCGKNANRFSQVLRSHGETINCLSLQLRGLRGRQNTHQGLDIPST